MTSALHFGNRIARSAWPMAKATFIRWNAANAPRLGAALAFYTVLSVAPLLVLSVAIAGIVFSREAATGQIVAQVQNVVGYQAGKAIQSMVLEAQKPAAGIIASIFGLLLLLFGASGVVVELHDSLNTAWGVKSSSSILQLVRFRFLAFAMVLGIGFLLLVSLLLNAAISAAGTFVKPYLPAPEAVLHIVVDVVSFLLITLLFALLYKVLPDARIEWRDVWVGAAVTSLLFSIGKQLIGLYLGKASVGSAYGAAGSLVVFLVWVYYSAQIFFLGAVFTHSYSERHGSIADARRMRTIPYSPQKETTPPGPEPVYGWNRPT
jgi:membrane protein